MENVLSVPRIPRLSPCFRPMLPHVAGEGGEEGVRAVLLPGCGTTEVVP